MTATSDRGLQAVCRTGRLSDRPFVGSGRLTEGVGFSRRRAGASRGRAQDDTLRHLAGCPEAPQGDEQLSRKGATIRVLRVAPRASVVRARYHWLRALK